MRLALDPELRERALAGANPPLRVRPAPQPDARGSRRRTPAWQVPDAVKAAVWQRDDHTCRYCGFRALRYQEVAVAGGNARDPDQMGTVCLFCHQCLHLGLAAQMRSAVLLWLPEVAQSDLSWMARELYLARISTRGAERAQRLLDALMTRRAPVRDVLGTDDPGVLARWLALAQRDDPAEADRGGPAGAGAGDASAGGGGAPPTPIQPLTEELLACVRLLPLDRRILRADALEFNQFPQVLAWWRSPQGPFGGRAAQGDPLAYPWLARLEAALMPEAGQAVAPGGSTSSAQQDHDPTEGAVSQDADAQASPTLASLAARLLRDAATFFRNVSDQNPALAVQMDANAGTYEGVADLVATDPVAGIDLPGGAGFEAGRYPVVVLAVRLLRDAADFFEAVGAQNAPLAEQMTDNAQVYRQLAQRLEDDPLGVLELG